VKLTKKPITRTADYYFLNSLIMDLNQFPCHNMSYNFKSKFRKNTYIFEHGTFYLIESIMISVLYAMFLSE